MAQMLTGLHPAVRERVRLSLQVADHYRIPIIVTSTYRSVREQQELYDRYLKGGSPWPANPPGQSSHQYGLAWDSVLGTGFDHLWPWWTAVREWAGFYVPPNDRPHAHVPNWRAYVFP